MVFAVRVCTCESVCVSVRTCEVHHFRCGEERGGELCAESATAEVCGDTAVTVRSTSNALLSPELLALVVLVLVLQL